MFTLVFRSVQEGDFLRMPSRVYQKKKNVGFLDVASRGLFFVSTIFSQHSNEQENAMADASKNKTCLEQKQIRNSVWQWLSKMAITASIMLLYYDVRAYNAASRRHLAFFYKNSELVENESS